MSNPQKRKLRDMRNNRKAKDDADGGSGGGGRPSKKQKGSAYSPKDINALARSVAALTASLKANDKKGADSDSDESEDGDAGGSGSANRTHPALTRQGGKGKKKG